MFHLRLQRNIFSVGILLLSLLLSSCVLTSKGPVLQEEPKQTLTMFSDNIPDITGEYVSEENKGGKKTLRFYPIHNSHNAVMLEMDETTVRVVLAPLQKQNMALLQMQDPEGKESEIILIPVRVTEKGILLYLPPSPLMLGRKQWNDELWNTLLAKHNIATTPERNKLGGQQLATGVKKEDLLAALNAMAAADAMGDGILLKKVGAATGDIEKAKRSQAFLKLVQTASPEAVQAALEEGIDLNVTDENGKTALILAAWKNPSVQVISILLKEKIAVDARDKTESTALMFACGYNTQEVVEMLIKAGADPKVHNVIGSNLLHSFAGSSKHKEMLPFLQRTGVDINAQTIHGRTPVMSALFNKESPDMVDLLIKAGADVHATTTGLGNILTMGVMWCASRAENAYLIPRLQALIAQKVDVNVPDKDGKTALHYAMATKNMALVDMLLQAGAKADSKDKEGATPLSALLDAEYRFDEEKYYPLALQLLKAGADVNSVGKDGNTLLTSLAENTKSAERLAELLDMGADPVRQNSNGKNALQLSESNWNLRKDGEKSSLLLLTAHRLQKPESLERLVRAGADINARDKEGRTALHNAVNAQSINIIQKMLVLGAGVDTRTQKGFTPLMNAAGHNTHPEVIQALLQAGADIHAKNADGNTPYMFAAWHNPKKEILEILRKAGADPLYSNSLGETALMLAAHSNTPEIVRIIIESGADVNASAKKGNTALLFAAESNKNAEVLQLLVQHGANPLAGRADVNNALTLAAISNENPAVIDFLLNQGIPNSIKFMVEKNKWDKRSAVTLALANKNPDILKALLRGKAEFDKANVLCATRPDDKYQVSPEHIKYLVFAGAELDPLCKRSHYGTPYTPLMFFADNNQPASIEMLLALGADGRIKNEDGTTAHSRAGYDLKKHPVYNKLLDAQFNAPRALTPELVAERDAFIAYLKAGTPATPVQTATAPATTAPAQTITTPAQTTPAPAPSAPTPSYPPLQSTGKPILMGHMVNAQNKSVDLDIQILATGETLTALRVDNIGGESVLWRSDGQEKALPIQVKQGDAVLAKGDAPIAVPLGDKENLVRITFADTTATFAKSGAKFRLTAFFASGNRAMAMFTVP